MPVTPCSLFNQVGLSLAGTVPWGTKPAVEGPGVYTVSLSEDPSQLSGVLETAPVDVTTVGDWIERVPSYTFRGGAEPDPQEVTAFLSTFWIPDESIVYIGKATSLKKRLGQYFSHRLGNRSPHAGGHWVKTLTCLDHLYVHYAVVDTAEQGRDKEAEALQYFKAMVSPEHLDRLKNPIPFANREHPQGNRKQKAISKDVLR